MNIQRWITASAILCLAFSSAYAAGVLEVKVSKTGDASGLSIHPDALRADARLDEVATSAASSSATTPSRLQTPAVTEKSPYNSPVLDYMGPRVVRRSSSNSERVVVTTTTRDSCGGTRTTSTVVSRPRTTGTITSSCGTGSTTTSSCGTRTTSTRSSGSSATAGKVVKPTVMRTTPLPTKTP